MTLVAPIRAPASSGVAPDAPGRPGRMEWVDRLAASDPGLNRFINAFRSVVTIGLILGAEFLFVHFTHALQVETHGVGLSATAAAQAAGANHEFLVIAMLLGAIVGMIISFGVMDVTARGQLVSMVIVPFPMLAALALGLEIGGHRVLALASLVVMLTVGTYFRRFGPRGFMGGMLLFMGDFFGFFLHQAITISDLGWLAAEVGVGLLVAVAVRFVLFYPHPAKALERIQRSYGARARKVGASALDLFDDPDHSEAEVRRLHRQLVRLNEAALMIDAQLGDSKAVAEGMSGERVHQRLFDVELALTNTARFAQAMGHLAIPSEQRHQVRGALLGIIGGDLEAAKAHATSLIEAVRIAGVVGHDEERVAMVVLHRFAGSVLDLTDALGDWQALGSARDGDEGSFQPSIMLFGGWLPGSVQVSSIASTERGNRRWDRIALAPNIRTAIQMGVAVSAAIALGDLLSGRRFYWAVIAAFITFMGANNSGEQSMKAVFRVLGTVVGITVGSLLAHLVGHQGYWSIAVILVALFFGFYLMRINYAFMVVGITVTVSQLYVQLNEFSNSLLLLRLEETAIGSAVAIAVVTLVLPLRTRRVLRVAMRAYLQAVIALVDHATEHLLDESGEGADQDLRTDARNVDAAYQAVIATMAPIRRTVLGRVDEDIVSAVRVASASRNYARNLVTDTEAMRGLDAATRVDITRGTDTLRHSLVVLVDAFNEQRDGTYTRSAALFDHAERSLEESVGVIDNGQLALRDLNLLDGSMARLAEIVHLQVTDYDTTVGAPVPRPLNASLS